MTNLTPVSAGKAPTRYGRLGFIAMIVVLQCAPVLAFELDDAAKSNVASSPQTGVSWLSGGVGDEAMAEMHKVSSAYNVHLMLTGPHGNYLAGIPFTVSRHSGQVTVSGVTEGPLLYLKLPAGRYQIAVEIDGAWQTRRVQVSASGQATKVRFVAKGE
ncbi:MAG: hypothetical protein IV101_01810 [Dechloromonas sp.]|uniref:hypothetical protein n=1 Tax=Dechloromonas sp. TaxID=1917218 RepID=UPI0027E5CBA3|nr:hypothetical protein [Dechloromonas sp.]MBT9519605.1 hypothetical protein [Dechloromonas sp.]